MTRKDSQRGVERGERVESDGTGLVVHPGGAYTRQTTNQDSIKQTQDRKDTGAYPNSRHNERTLSHIDNGTRTRNICAVETISFSELIAQPIERIFCDQDSDGDNELLLAIVKQSEAYAMFIILELVKRKATPLLNLQNNQGSSALHLSVKVDLINVTKVLVEAGADLTAVDHAGNTPLHCACSLGYLKHVVVLTSDLSKKKQSGQSIENAESKQKFKEIAEAANYKAWTCVHLAAMNCHTPVVEYLVKVVGVDVNKRGGGRGMTCLHQAVQAHDVTMVIFLLLGVKADVSSLTYDNLSPVQLAAGYNHEDLVSILLSCGAYVTEYKKYSEQLEATDDDDSLL